MTILGLGFIVMYFGQSIAKTTGTVGPQWLVAVYAIHTLGELCLSPIGLSMVTKLSPARMVSLMMGLWFLSSAAANKAAGELEGIVEQYHISVYGVLVGSSIGAAAVLLVLVPILKKWMHGAEDTH
jgi:POT family proton-dependent oligopeptide transporter